MESALQAMPEELGAIFDSSVPQCMVESAIHDYAFGKLVFVSFQNFIFQFQAESVQ
ncbi:hypothetical protein I5V32_16490 [Stenotrophomonas maltophilia]|uniref:Uncharacterized protein n=1 Tax=Stenotrophomonas maltophilia TaxID=40324 RepID=A0AA41CCU4_STEMA|nr:MULTISPECIES: hypothetical protein [Stenotrophomonas]MBH1586180.1 hypothetical protein [Stenotrophomonas maltophilia]MBH1717720.1 hypothetical protein [Stenotrophomonas maltophilia]MBH1788934.1 hypothetical protein [Stenotrophomonas maltophilia]MCR1819631.1 hypothetical protein [Stenotrophomonas muris]MCU1073625.1 hypothetical protein [Stenotrophomonas maltophilia]